MFDKPFGWSSFKVVYKVKEILQVKKVGHAGTLDPRATGLLILCTGRKTKEIVKYQDMIKEYTGSILLGKQSPSMDLETELTDEKPVDHITDEMILEASKRFLGPILQLPPMYSALKHKGKNLYEIARKGKVVDRNEREVTVYDFEITSVRMPEVFFKIRCSKGTYIRVIAHDIGTVLGCGAVLSSLRRTAIGDFRVEKAFKMEDFLSATKETAA
jgi:tRNA pseudouridine55 synthase